jgi:hypothetical protein
MGKEIVMPDAMVSDLQRRYAEGTLPAETIVPCETIPGWDWQEEPKHRHPEEFIAHQRKRHAEGTLPAWKVQRLEAIPGWSW